MSNVKIGDTVCCKLKNGFIAYNHADEYEITQEFNVIAKTEGGFLVEVPSSVFLHNCFLISDEKCKQYNISQRFIGGFAHFASDEHILSMKPRADGEKCDRCGDFCAMAEKNVGSVFICYTCRHYRTYR